MNADKDIIRAPEPMIEVEGIKKYFEISNGIIKRKKQYIKAVDDISLKINKGEIVGLVGESGSGKTTLARVMLRLAKMSGGNVNIDGINLRNATKADMKRLHQEVAVVFQDPAANLNPRQTVESSIMRPMIIHGIPKREAKQKGLVCRRRIISGSFKAESFIRRSVVFARRMFVRIGTIRFGRAILRHGCKIY